MLCSAYGNGDRAIRARGGASSGGASRRRVLRVGYPFFLVLTIVILLFPASVGAATVDSAIGDWVEVTGVLSSALAFGLVLGGVLGAVRFRGFVRH